jgi:hypothetical protein
MTHEHGSEFQVRIVHEDDSEELSGWMNGHEEVVAAIARLRGSPARAYWLQTRNIVCLNCPQKEPSIVEFRLTLTAPENTRLPRQTDRRLFGVASGRTSSA